MLKAHKSYILDSSKHLCVKYVINDKCQHQVKVWNKAMVGPLDNTLWNSD